MILTRTRSLSKKVQRKVQRTFELELVRIILRGGKNKYSALGNGVGPLSLDYGNEAEDVSRPLADIARESMF